MATFSYVPRYAWQLGMSLDKNALYSIYHSLFIDPSLLKCLFLYNLWKWFSSYPNASSSKHPSWVPPATTKLSLFRIPIMLSFISYVPLMVQMHMSYLFHKTMNSLAFTLQCSASRVPGNAKKCLISLYISSTPLDQQEWIPCTEKDSDILPQGF